jgi:hypothetical protein
MKDFVYCAFWAAIIAVLGVTALSHHMDLGPLVFGLGLIPVLGLVLTGRNIRGAIPDLVFGAVDTGLLTIPALWGGQLYGVAGAIAGGVIGDALTDGIAGFFEGFIAQWLRKKGIEESREAVTSALGKMAGCLLGAGLMLTFALGLGVRPVFG